MEKFIELGEKIEDLNIELRKECVNFLKEILKDEIPLVLLTDDDETSFYVSVTYDGGNHPEYASNAYSMVYSVWMKDEQIYLELDDCDEYGIDRVETMELYNVCCTIKEALSKE